MKEKLRELEGLALDEIESAGRDRSAIEAIRIKYLGRKGLITELFKKMSEVPATERPEIGALINVIKASVTKALD